ncbi:hypothetical protein D1007_08587 [Hordeum vulgare]|nr:hypothetical protein D1007_08587 [Hordeum vulgare]
MPLFARSSPPFTSCVAMVLPSERRMLTAMTREKPALEPALGRSTVLNREELDKVLPMIAIDSNEWGPTNMWSSSRPLAKLDATIIAIHRPALFSDPLSPFSDFFNIVLSHY